jgi:hypothetical protein
MAWCRDAINKKQPTSYKQQHSPAAANNNVHRVRMSGWPRTETCPADATVHHNCRADTRPTTAWKGSPESGKPVTEHLCAVGEVVKAGLLQFTEPDPLLPRKADTTSVFPRPVISTPKMQATAWYRFIFHMLATPANRDAIAFLHETQLASVPTLPILPTACLTPPLYAAYCEALNQDVQDGGETPAASAATATVDVIAVYKTICMALIQNKIATANEALEHPERVLAVSAALAAGNHAKHQEALEISREHARRWIEDATEFTKIITMVEKEHIDESIERCLLEEGRFRYLRSRASAYALTRADSESARVDIKQFETITVAETTAMLAGPLASPQRVAEAMSKDAGEDDRGCHVPGEKVDASSRRTRKREESLDDDGEGEEDDDDDDDDGDGDRGMECNLSSPATTVAIEERESEKALHRAAKQRSRPHTDTVEALTALSHTASIRYIRILEFLIWMQICPSDLDGPGSAEISQVMCRASDLPEDARVNMQQFVMTAVQSRLHLRPSHAPGGGGPSLRARERRAADPARANITDLEEIRDDPVFFLGLCMMRQAVNPDHDEHAEEVASIYHDMKEATDRLSECQLHEMEPTPADPNEPNHTPNAEARLAAVAKIKADRAEENRRAVRPGLVAHGTSDEDFAFMGERMSRLQLRDDILSGRTAAPETSGGDGDDDDMDHIVPDDRSSGEEFINP